MRAADAAGVLPEYDITDIMVHLDGPVAAEVREQVSRACLVRGQAGDPGDGDRAEEFPVRPVAVPLDEEHLRDVREQFPDRFGGRQGPDGARIDAAVAAVHASPANDSRGRAPAAANSFFWFSPMVKMKKAPAASILRACLRCVCIWSAVMTASLRSAAGILSSSSRKTGISFVPGPTPAVQLIREAQLPLPPVRPVPQRPLMPARLRPRALALL